MNIHQEIQAREIDIEKLPDQWKWLRDKRKDSLKKEKEQAARKPAGNDLCQVIDEGYLAFLCCIVKVANRKN